MPARYTLDHLHALGFDASTRLRWTPDHDRFAVACTRCAAAVINGVPCHEHGCPNAVHECHGCNTLVPINVRYCAECQS